MKKFIITSILAALFASGTTLMAQENQEENLGLPGDNLNLYAVMKLFQESKTLEDFERSLNDEKTNINNLDLNGDNLVDYIRVVDNIDGDVHNIVLQVAVNEKENQDIAVFTVQRFDNGQVQIQLTGDEELYGKDYIIEPNFDDANAGETTNPGYTGNTRTVNGQNVTYVRTTTFEIAAWPLVRFIYLPSYSIWRSSWYWGYYPSYWHPWRPFFWHYYYGYHYNWYNDYYGHYRRWHYHRYSRWNDFYYTGRRTYSPDVYHRLQIGSYKTTYSHPDQRKDGESMFAKTHPDQYRRSSDKSSGDRDRVSTSTSRRSTNTVTNKSVTNRSSDKNAGINRRSATGVTNKSLTNPKSENNTVQSRKSSATVTRRSEINPPSGQNAVSNRTTRQSKSTTVSSSNRRTSNSKKSEAKSKKEVKTKESQNKESTRRK
jgi:hypothetical protein